jgi:hypothetical protein
MSKGTPHDDTRTKALQQRRERLLTDLTVLERQRRQGTIEESPYRARRHELITALEEIYAKLDRGAAA